MKRPHFRRGPRWDELAGGNFYTVDATTGQTLWRQQLGGAIGGGVITYTVDGAQKAAVAMGFTHPVWPTNL